MRQSARNLAAFGSITVVMYSMFLTFFGSLLPYGVSSGSALFINPLLLCGIAGLAAAGFGLAAAFLPPRRVAISRVLVCSATVITVAVAAVMIISLFDALLSLIFGVPALILSAAAALSFMRIGDKNGAAQ